MTPPDSTAPAPDSPARSSGSPVEVFLAFLRLGLTSFGGPVAHLGYFRTEFVERRRWLDDRSFSDLVALCQFLPGPASSQVGMALGLTRAGGLGCLAAWIGFTLPSALALILFAQGVQRWAGLAAGGVVQGLKVAAVAVVAQAVWGMARSLCPDRPRAMLALAGALLTLLVPTAAGQVVAIVMTGVAGWLVLKLPPPGPVAHAACGVSRIAGVAALALFLLLLLGLPLLSGLLGDRLAGQIDGFYRAGALVFGGGHVVLPLLQAAVVPTGMVTDSAFLAGYGAAQAVPGPLFTFAAYLGAASTGPVGGWAGGLLFLVIIFLPAFLLVVGALPFWDSLRRRAPVQSALAGVNAGVVGLLLSALYDPVWTGTIHGRSDFAVALAAFGLLVHARVSPAVVVLLCAAAGFAVLE